MEAWQTPLALQVISLHTLLCGLLPVWHAACIQPHRSQDFSLCAQGQGRCPSHHLHCTLDASKGLGLVVTYWVCAGLAGGQKTSGLTLSLRLSARDPWWHLMSEILVLHTISICDSKYFSNNKIPKITPGPSLLTNHREMYWITSPELVFSAGVIILKENPWILSLYKPWISTSVYHCLGHSACGTTENSLPFCHLAWKLSLEVPSIFGAWCHPGIEWLWTMFSLTRAVVSVSLFSLPLF